LSSLVNYSRKSVFPLDPGGKNEEKDYEPIIRVDQGKVTIIRLGKNDCHGQNTPAYFCLKELDKEKKVL
jgi:hypothetical protein